MISPGVLLCVQNVWFFGLLVGLKGKKWSKMRKKFCLLHSISKETYIIWFSFMAHMYKMIISMGFFRIGKMAKNGKKWTKIPKNSFPHSISQELYLIWLWFLVYLCKMMISPASFFIFSNFWFFWFLGGEGKRVKNDP